MMKRSAALVVALLSWIAPSAKAGPFSVAKAKDPPCGSMGCATITPGGGSYCRYDGGSSLPIRELQSADLYRTSSPVQITMHPAADCKPNPAVPTGTVIMQISGAGSAFDMKFGATDVALTPEPQASHVHWLQSAPTIGENMVYVVYLLDEPAGADQIIKHYRIEMFDDNCRDRQPKEGVNVKPADPGPACTGGGTKGVAPIAPQTGSGDGYEPKH